MHAAPEWSNERAGRPADEVASELLREFLSLAGATGAEAGLEPAYLEAHRWNNAYPLNPRPAGPDGAHFLLDRGLQLGSAGDWSWGPRVADAFNAGHSLGSQVARLL